MRRVRRIHREFCGLHSWRVQFPVLFHRGVFVCVFLVFKGNCLISEIPKSGFLEPNSPHPPFLPSFPAAAPALGSPSGVHFWESSWPGHCVILSSPGTFSRSPARPSRDAPPGCRRRPTRMKTNETDSSLKGGQRLLRRRGPGPPRPWDHPASHPRACVGGRTGTIHPGTELGVPGGDLF